MDFSISFLKEQHPNLISICSWKYGCAGIGFTWNIIINCYSLPNALFANIQLIYTSALRSLSNEQSLDGLLELRHAAQGTHKPAIG